MDNAIKINGTAGDGSVETLMQELERINAALQRALDGKLEVAVVNATKPTEANAIDRSDVNDCFGSQRPSYGVPLRFAHAGSAAEGWRRAVRFFTGEDLRPKQRQALEEARRILREAEVAIFVPERIEEIPAEHLPDRLRVFVFRHASDLCAYFGKPVAKLSREELALWLSRHIDAEEHHKYESASR